MFRQLNETQSGYAKHLESLIPGVRDHATLVGSTPLSHVFTDIVLRNDVDFDVENGLVIIPVNCLDWHSPPTVLFDGRFHSIEEIEIDDPCGSGVKYKASHIIVDEFKKWLHANNAKARMTNGR